MKNVWLVAGALLFCVSCNEIQSELDQELEVCKPENNASFCARYQIPCGPFQAEDNCGNLRPGHCGTCEFGECNDHNQCICNTSETDEEFCTRNSAECGVYQALDNCGEPRSVDCGFCPHPAVCAHLEDNRCSVPMPPREDKFWTDRCGCEQQGCSSFWCFPEFL